MERRRMARFTLSILLLLVTSVFAQLPTTPERDITKYGFLSTQHAKFYDIGIADVCHIGVNCKLKQKNSPCGVCISNRGAHHADGTQLVCGQTRFRGHASEPAKVWQIFATYMTKIDFRNVQIRKPRCEIVGTNVLNQFPTCGVSTAGADNSNTICETGDWTNREFDNNPATNGCCAPNKAEQIEGDTATDIGICRKWMTNDWTTPMIGDLDGDAIPSCADGTCCIDYDDLQLACGYPTNYPHCRGASMDLGLDNDTKNSTISSVAEHVIPSAANISYTLPQLGKILALQVYKLGHTASAHLYYFGTEPNDADYFTIGDNTFEFDNDSLSEVQLPTGSKAPNLVPILKDINNVYDPVRTFNQLKSIIETVMPELVASRITNPSSGTGLPLGWVYLESFDVGARFNYTIVNQSAALTLCYNPADPNCPNGLVGGLDRVDYVKGTDIQYPTLPASPVTITEISNRVPTSNDIRADLIYVSGTCPVFGTSGVCMAAGDYGNMKFKSNLKIALTTSGGIYNFCSTAFQDNIDFKTLANQEIRTGDITTGSNTRIGDYVATKWFSNAHDYMFLGKSTTTPIIKWDGPYVCSNNPNITCTNGDIGNPPYKDPSQCGGLPNTCIPRDIILSSSPGNSGSSWFKGTLCVPHGSLTLGENNFLNGHFYAKYIIGGDGNILKCGQHGP